MTAGARTGASPMPGMDENAMLGPALVAAAESVGATFVPTDLDWAPRAR